MFPSRRDAQLHKTGAKKLQDIVQDPIFLDASPKTDVLIAVMGYTGAGKSTFINTLLGQKVVAVGHGMKSCTAHLEAVPVPRGHGVYRHFPSWPEEERLVLVDTPGFDDSSLTDVEILKRLATWLAASYSQNMRLAGIIYLQDINNRRMTGSSSRYLSVFQKLCGEGAYPSIILGTTQWCTVKAEYMEWAELRQDQLRQIFWVDMLRSGSIIRRVDEDRTWSLINDIYPRIGDQGVLLRIQEELVHLKKILPQTDAARYLKQSMEQALQDLESRSDSREGSDKLRAQIKSLDLSLGMRLREFLRL